MPVMRNAGGYVRAYRSLLDWEWYDDASCVRVMLHLMLSVNWERKQWQGHVIEPGQIITSMDKLAERLGLSRSAIRRTLDKLKSTGEVTIRTNNHWTAVTLVNWAEYQESQPTIDQPKSRPATDRRPTTDRPPATTEEVKNIRRKEENTILPEGFNEFWSAYDYTKKKPDAIRAWAKLTAADRTACMAKVPAFVQSKPDKQYRPYPATFLNGRMWEDEIVFPLFSTAHPVVHKLPEATGWITDVKRTA